MHDRGTKLLTGVLALALLAAVVGAIALAVFPIGLTEPLTEFYVLNSEERAGEYPTNLSVGETGTVVVGIENHERRSMTYTVVISTQDGVLESRTVTVAEDQRWRGEFSFAFDSPGEREVTFALYRGRNPDRSQEPYRDLRLVVTAR